MFWRAKDREHLVIFIEIPGLDSVVVIVQIGSVI